MNLPDGAHPAGRPRRLLPPTPRPYHLTEPFLDRGLWHFWLAADPEVLEYIYYLACILQPPNSPFQRRTPGRLLYAINPRYDHMDAWQWVKQLLDDETAMIELSPVWEDALDDAQSANAEDNPPSSNSDKV